MACIAVDVVFEDVRISLLTGAWNDLACPVGSWPRLSFKAIDGAWNMLTLEVREGDELVRSRVSTRRVLEGEKYWVIGSCRIGDDVILIGLGTDTELFFVAFGVPIGELACAFLLDGAFARDKGALLVGAVEIPAVKSIVSTENGLEPSVRARCNGVVRRVVTCAETLLLAWFVVAVVDCVFLDDGIGEELDARSMISGAELVRGGAFELRKGSCSRFE
jgi:hypothetical protein